jgi:sulfate permease, SulP family
LSLLLLIYRTTHPHGAVLGQLPGTEAYRGIQRHPEALTFPGLLIWRTGGDLFFASVDRMEDDLKTALKASRSPPRHVLLDFSSVNFIDTSACDALLTFIKEMQSRGVTFSFARVRDYVRDRMLDSGMGAVVDPAYFYERLTDGVQAWRQHSGSGL